MSPRYLPAWLSRLAPALALVFLVAGTCSEDACDLATDPSCTSSTQTRITSDDPDPSVIGQVVRVDWSVSSSNGTPTGRVEVRLDEDAVESCSASVEFGGCEIRIMTAGEKKLRANYLGGAGFVGSSDTEDHRVNKASTVTSIISHLPDPSVVGESFPVNVSVSVEAPGSGTPRGTVTVSDGTDSCTTPVSDGGCSLTLTEAGAKTLTATYEGSESYRNSSDSDAHEVAAAATTTTITSHDPNPSLVGDALLISYEVTVDAPGSGSPTGNVTVSEGTASCTATVAAGACSVTPTTSGAKTLTVTYEGDSNFTGSSGSAPHQVASALSTVTISDDPDPSVVGQPVTVLYTVTSPGGQPTGMVTVTVDDESGDSCSASVQEGGCEIVLTQAGPKTLTATYSGDANFVGNEASDPHQVNRAATSTTITLDDPDPSVVGEAVSVGFAVAVELPGAGTPTGNVVVSDGTDICVVPVELGVCTFQLTTAGQKTLTATYDGDANFEGSADSQPHEVTRAPTTVAFSDSPDPSVVGQPVTVSFDVTSGAGTPTGAVTVTVDDASGDSCSTSVAIGSCQITLTAAGAKTLTVTYAGDANFLGSAASGDHQVNRAQTSTVITGDDPDPSAVGQGIDVSYSVTVDAPGSGSPTGNVTVSDGTISCITAVAQGGCTLTPITTGAKTLTASYGGDANFVGSSDTEPHQVTAAATTVTVTDVPDPSVVGQAVTVGFTVTASGGGTPTGTVTVTVNDGSGATCSASVAVGACQITFTTAGAKTITATYSGDGRFLGSSTDEPHQVNRAATTTLITSDDPDPSVVGQAVTVNYVVAVNAPGSGTPTGNVTVTDGTNSCIGGAGASSCSLTLTTGGPKTITATYAGDADFEPSSDTEPHLVNRAPTATVITSDNPDPSLVGQSVRIDFVVTAAAGQPTGTVEVTVSGEPGSTCSASVAQGGCNIALTTAGAKTLTASYLGDANFDISSDAEGHQVNAASTTTQITSDAPDPSLVGQAVTVEWGVTVTGPGSGTPTGNVTVTVNDVSGATCSAAVAIGSCQITLTSVGPKTLTASYAGDGNFGPSSDTEPHAVNSAGTTTQITSDTPDPSVVGQPVTVNFTVTPNAPASGTPTGNVSVTVNDGSGATCSAAVSVGSCQITLTSPGPKTFTASYAGDGNFNASSDTELHNVNQGQTTTTITSDNPDPSLSGQAVTVVFTVTVNAPGSGTPTGTVTVTVNDGSGATCSASVAVGFCQITLFRPPNPPNKTLTATYAGDANFQGSSDTEPHSVQL